MNTIKKIHISPSQLIPLEFLLLITAGMVLLMLPWSTASGEHTGIITALFTSTTCVCVTGLVVVDTFSHWTVFGQLVMLILIQFGGLGMVAVSSSVFVILRKRFSLRDRILLSEAFGMDKPRGIVVFLKFVLKGTLLVEGIGALCYALYFVPRIGFLRGLWVSIFFSISAFCNAGIDILGPNSMIPFQSNVFLMVTTMALIVLGGIGYIVWLDIYMNLASIKSQLKQRRFIRLQTFTEHTRLVIMITFFLIFGGAFLVWLMEYNNSRTIGSMSIGDQMLNSLFQSISFRTAGFASFPQDGLRIGTTAIGDILMFIGGSPVGTAGGVKTTTFAFIILNTLAFIRNRDNVTLFHRTVRRKLINKAAAIITVSVFSTIVFTILLLYLEDVTLADALYEVQSALSTVGLSRNLTSSLHDPGRILIIIAMYIGRIGPISMALFFNALESSEQHIKNAYGKFFVG